MKLYLVQHGAACAKEVDPERPLTEQGKDDVDRMAAFLGQAGIRVERVIHSGKLRAAQTAEHLARALAPGVELETSSVINPNDDSKLFDWRSASGMRDTLVVGHLPFMAKLVALLVVGDESKIVVDYQAGSVVCLQLADDRHWQIDWMIRPELVRKTNTREPV
ncbi:MAG: phosphohistidine phosphatase SixA [Pseudomonadota bacterium]|nr:MAG: phosphohistidine phosphatase SixA [Pseudomonadota bacterium]